MGFTGAVLSSAGFPEGGAAMEEKERVWGYCHNLKMPDPQCQYCLWLEWNSQYSHCKNRKKIICALHVDEVFGTLSSKTIN
ncbi:MAG: hypothetical protein MUF69_05145 [Desulfobacterota bacterium]|jgi:hypothetical protein|nr:hypothetical protein [Thermodesulfobacteriota bacterium]